MRKLVPVVALAVLACGSSGGGGGGETPVTGTIGGKAFTPAVIRSATADPTVCPNLPPPPGGSGPAGVSAIAVSFASKGDFCADLANPNCPRHQDAQTVTVFVANVAGSATPQAPARIGKGTYTLNALSLLNGLPGSPNPLVANATALSTNASCGGTALVSGATPASTIRIDDVTATQITGFIDATWCGADPQCAAPDRLKGTFVAPLCPVPDICGIANSQTVCSYSTAPPACLP